MTPGGTTNPSPPATTKTRHSREKVSGQICVCLTGFREPARAELLATISRLSGKVCSTVDACTHVVAPLASRTAKTLTAAVLPNKWLMPEAWLTASAHAGQFVREDGIEGARQGTDALLRGQRIWLTAAFRALAVGTPHESACEKMVHEVLCDVGGASVDQADDGKFSKKNRANAERADYILCATDDDVEATRTWLCPAGEAKSSPEAFWIGTFTSLLDRLQSVDGRQGAPYSPSATARV
jgi:hypothetical protein